MKKWWDRFISLWCWVEAAAQLGIIALAAYIGFTEGVWILGVFALIYSLISLTTNVYSGVNYWRLQKT